MRRKGWVIANTVCDNRLFYKIYLITSMLFVFDKIQQTADNKQDNNRQRTITG